ncbi:MAG: hypothetical protein ABI846_10820, partial [Rudaea sp.]
MANVCAAPSSAILATLGFSIFVALSLLSIAPRALAVPSTKCNAAEFRQFDFWIGDWDSFDIDNGKESPRSVARNHVDSILDGCVLREDYDQFDGLHGQS